MLRYSIICCIDDSCAECKTQSREGLAYFTPRTAFVGARKAVNILENKYFGLDQGENPTIGFEQAAASIDRPQNAAGSPARRRECLTGRAANHAFNAEINIGCGVEFAYVRKMHS